jgi:hypothetical protein
LPSFVRVSVTTCFISSRALAAWGKFTGIPRSMVMERVATMKKTRRKNMVSIMGMISMRAFFLEVLGSLTG